VEVDAVVLAGGVAVVVAHGQVASPNLRVKGSHFPANDCCRFHLQDPVHAVALDVHVWSVIYALICGTRESASLLCLPTLKEIRHQTQGHLH
jgi:hypothetical protein